MEASIAKRTLSLSVAAGVAIAFQTAPLAWADTPQTTLSPVRLFIRCYSHLTSSPPAPNHPLLAQVKAGTLTAVAACMKVFDEASLQPSGASQGYLVSDTPEGRSVLKTLTDFHRTWFPSDSLLDAVPGGFDSAYLSAHVTDETEGAYALTRALFTSGVSFSDIVTLSTGMEAIRTNGPSNFESATGNYFQTATAPNVQTYVNLNPQLVQVGLPIGARPLSANPTKLNLIINDTDYIYWDNTFSGEAPTTAQLVHGSLGGGIIGTKSYLMLNLGRGDGTPSNGGLIMSRRWSKSVFRDLLCRNIPVMRLADAQPLVETTTTASTPPFRTNPSCMQCHGSMDPLAAVTRNAFFYHAPTHYVSANQSFMSLYVAPVTLAAETGFVDDDPVYFHRPPNGTLLYRSYDGTLVDKPLSGMADLGNALASSNDLYACAAAHYYKFFTGVGVNLQDIGDASLPALSTAELTYRNDVIQLGQTLKTTQSLRSLIQAIISSPLYQSNSMRYPGP